MSNTLWNVPESCENAKQDIFTYHACCETKTTREDGNPVKLLKEKKINVLRVAIHG